MRNFDGSVKHTEGRSQGAKSCKQLSCAEPQAEQLAHAKELRNALFLSGYVVGSHVVGREGKGLRRIPSLPLDWGNTDANPSMANIYQG